MILMLLQSTHNNYSNHTRNALNPNRHTTAMNSILPSLNRIHAKLGRKRSLVARKLAIHQPRADAKAQHGSALATNPDLVVRRRVAARNALVQCLASRRRADGNQRRAGGGKSQQARVQKMA